MSTLLYILYYCTIMFEKVEEKVLISVDAGGQVKRTDRAGGVNKWDVGSLVFQRGEIWCLPAVEGSFWTLLSP